MYNNMYILLCIAFIVLLMCIISFFWLKIMLLIDDSLGKNICVEAANAKVMLNLLVSFKFVCKAGNQVYHQMMVLCALLALAVVMSFNVHMCIYKQASLLISMWQL